MALIIVSGFQNDGDEQPIVVWEVSDIWQLRNTELQELLAGVDTVRYSIEGQFWERSGDILFSEAVALLKKQSAPVLVLNLGPKAKMPSINQLLRDRRYRGARTLKELERVIKGQRQLFFSASEAGGVKQITQGQARALLQNK